MMRIAEGQGTRDETSLLRRLLLLLVLAGSAGLTFELLLLEHYETASQWAPLALLAAAMASALLVALRPGRSTLQLFQAVMSLCVAAGLVGFYLHYQGNVEFEIERDPALRGFALFWEAMRGATPALAPGAMAQLGLLGLIYAWRHPAAHSASFRSSAARRADIAAAGAGRTNDEPGDSR